MNTPEQLPRRFGSYLLFDRIGRGGMADIYLARVDTSLGAGRRVVVKQILPELSNAPQFSKMLIEEAKLVSGLRHANVVQVLNLGREKGRLFIAMEYVEGFDLHQLLSRLSKARLPLPAEFAIFMGREVLSALDFAHRASDEDGVPLGIVHRDVTPSNVLISFEGEVKLCDFGIARAFGEHTKDASTAVTATPGGSRLVGKAAYMSPEHAKGESLDRRADIFAAAIVIWELCAGRRLYKGSEEKMLELAREGAIPPLPDRGIPHQRELQRILDRALSYEPDERWPTAGDMLQALDDYMMQAQMRVSPLKFGAFLTEHFEADVIEVRRHRERAAEALSIGPPVLISEIPAPIAQPSAPAVEPAQPGAAQPGAAQPGAAQPGAGPLKGGQAEERARAAQNTPSVQPVVKGSLLERNKPLRWALIALAATVAVLGAAALGVAAALY